MFNIIFTEDGSLVGSWDEKGYANSIITKTLHKKY